MVTLNTSGACASNSGTGSMDQRMKGSMIKAIRYRVGNSPYAMLQGSVWGCHDGVWGSAPWESSAMIGWSSSGHDATKPGCFLNRSTTSRPIQSEQAQGQLFAFRILKKNGVRRTGDRSGGCLAPTNNTSSFNVWKLGLTMWGALSADCSATTVPAQCQ